MIKDELLNIKLNPSNLKHYLGKGYIGRVGDTLKVSSLDLPKSSKLQITRLCDSCNSESIIRRVKYKPECRNCVMQRVNSVRKDINKTTCLCGKPKSYQGKTCRGCRDITGENNPLFGKSNPALDKYNDSYREDNHWNWQGGKPRKRDGQSQQWSVKVRKVGECLLCRSTENLEAHHLESHAVRQDIRWEVSNGVCLCNKCHINFHKEHGYLNNTAHQFNGFKEAYNASN